MIDSIFDSVRMGKILIPPHPPLIKGATGGFKEKHHGSP